MFGWRGAWAGHIRASRGIFPPFLRLQGLQAATMFVHVVFPPRLRGTTWSKVKSSRSDFPQYWQEKLSRKNTLNRVKAGFRAWFT